MKRIFLAACFFLASLGARAQNDACAGVDLVERMRSSNPRAYAAYEKDVARIPDVDGLLWRVEKPGRPPSYLFGTMHVSDESALAHARATEATLRRSRIVLTELGDIDEAKKQQIAIGIISSGVRREGGALKIIRGKKDIAEVTKLLEARRMSFQAADHVAPWVTLLTLSIPACVGASLQRHETVVDEKVAEMARAANVPVTAIETVEEQVRAFASLDERLIARSLVDTARRPGLVDDGFATTLRLYREKRVGAFHTALRRAVGLTPQEERDNQVVMQALGGNRNAVMAKRVTPEIERGGAFVAVGALHLPGADGLVALMRKAGYEVTKEW